MTDSRQRATLVDDLGMANYCLSRYAESQRCWESELDSRGESYLIQHAIWHAEQQSMVLRVCRDAIASDPHGGATMTERMVVRLVAREFMDHDDFRCDWVELVETQLRECGLI